MKISTETIDIDITIDEFEQILDKNLLEQLLGAIASLTAKLDTQSPSPTIAEAVNKLISSASYANDEYQRDDDDFGFFDEDEEYFDDNDIVNRLYDNILGDEEVNL